MNNQWLSSFLIPLAHPCIKICTANAKCSFKASVLVVQDHPSPINPTTYSLAQKRAQLDHRMCHLHTTQDKSENKAFLHQTNILGKVCIMNSSRR